jgi:hypothetical protein
MVAGIVKPPGMIRGWNLFDLQQFVALRGTPPKPSFGHELGLRLRRRAGLGAGLSGIRLDGARLPRAPRVDGLTVELEPQPNRAG